MCLIVVGSVFFFFVVVVKSVFLLLVSDGSTVSFVDGVMSAVFSVCEVDVWLFEVLGVAESLFAVVVDTVFVLSAVKVSLKVGAGAFVAVLRVVSATVVVTVFL